MQDLEFNILIVDDIPDNIDVLRAVVAPLNCKISVATNGQRALNLVQKVKPDLILLDVMMPDLDGFEVCRRIRQTDAIKEIPIIFVTGRADDVAKGFEVGGNDYIAKPIQADEVIARVKHQIEKTMLIRELRYLNSDLESRVRERTAELATVNRKLREEINERRYMQDRLKYLSEHDFVSRTYNRNALEVYVADIISKQSHETQPLSSYIQIDINRFKVVNDSCGCVAGDELLAEVAEILNTVAGNSGFIARLTNDRFVIIYTHQSLQAVEILLTNIKEQLKQYQFVWDDFSFSVETTLVLIPISIHFTSLDQLIMVGDELTYQAKKSGNFDICRYQFEEAQRSILLKKNWALRLVDALKRDMFQVHVQQIRSLKESSTKVKLEALIRLYSVEQNGLMYPDMFLGAADRYQLLPDLDKWMISQVVRFLSENKDLQNSIQSIAVNLSSSTLKDSELVSFVKQVTNHYAVSPTLLGFEVTETEQIIHFHTAANVLNGLHEMGCEVLIDDFGSGYSSYQYLREFPFDIIKIDGVFIREIEQSASSMAMVRSILELARQLEKPVVAEYVENEHIKTILQELQVDWGQGYLFHRPELLNRTVIESMIVDMNKCD